MRKGEAQDFGIINIPNKTIKYFNGISCNTTNRRGRLAAVDSIAPESRGGDGHDPPKDLAQWPSYEAMVRDPKRVDGSVSLARAWTLTVNLMFTSVCSSQISGRHSSIRHNGAFAANDLASLFSVELNRDGLGKVPAGRLRSRWTHSCYGAGTDVWRGGEEGVGKPGNSRAWC